MSLTLESSGIHREPAPLLRRLPWKGMPGTQVEQLLDREWLVTNGLGGFASGTIGGVPTRGYHGLLVSALPAPLGRLLLLGPVLEQLALPDGTTVRLARWNTRPIASSYRIIAICWISRWRPACRSGATRSTASWSSAGCGCPTVATPSSCTTAC